MARWSVEKWKMLLTVLSFTLLVWFAEAQLQDRICATSKFNDQCLQLQRGNSEVICAQVQDSIECAQRIRNGTADFGVFSAETTLQLASLGWDGLTVVKELRHNDRNREQADFHAVAIVRTTHTGGLGGLRGSKFCHPGFHYGRTQRWSERFLKHFERLVVPASCANANTAAEIETAALSSFFSTACRPGVWSNIPKEDAELKSKYSNLCEQCPNANQCSYDNNFDHHQAALQCLTSGGGDVAYVSLQDAQKYFDSQASTIGDYAFLCPNGTMQSVTGNAAPCTWLTQPWSLLIAKSTRSVETAARIERWMRPNSSPSGWESAITEIITRDSHTVHPVNFIQAPVDYLRAYRSIPIASDLCSTGARWCTTSLEEAEKCQVVSHAALTTGIFPLIECSAPTTSRLACLDEIASARADFAGIDSNYGYLARQFNLTSAMFQETEKEKYSSVVVLVRDGSRFERFENLREARACFPEFGGIASIAFINVGRSRGIFNRNECNYGHLFSDFFSETCAPGSRDILHDPRQENPEALCTLCRLATPVPREAAADVDPDDEEATTVIPEDFVEGAAEDDEYLGPHSKQAPVNTNQFCEANSNNRFYGTRGALTCLNEVGEIAVVEAQNLAEHARALGLNPNEFRVLCRNGTLAAYTGFDVDEECYLTTIVDGEVVVNRASTKTNGIVNALMSLDVYLQNDPDFRMYNIYGGVTNLLFEDSALGLVSPQHTELGQAVQNYVRLFENIEDCQNSAAQPTLAPGIQGGRAAILTINAFMTLVVALIISCLKS